MDPALQFGETVKRLRKGKGLSQEELGHAADIHPTQVSHIEAGARSPRFMTIVNLARALEVEPGRLFDQIR